MKPYKIINTKQLIKEDYCDIEKQNIILPNGEKTNWYIFNNPDSVIVIPQTKNHEFILQKSYRHGCGETTIEFCAGQIDPHEKPKEAAIRELLEETGYESKELEKIGELYASPSSSKMKYHIFFAKNCILKGQKLESAEQIEPFLLSSNSKVSEKLAKNKNITTQTLAAWGLFQIKNAKQL